MSPTTESEDTMIATNCKQTAPAGLVATSQITYIASQ